MSHRSALFVSAALAVVFVLGLVFVARPDVFGREAPSATAPATVPVAATTPPDRANAPTPRVIEIPVMSGQQQVTAGDIAAGNSAVAGDSDHHDNHNGDKHHDGDKHKGHDDD